MNRRVLIGLLLLVLVLTPVGLYAYGRSTCPPPGWWLSVFQGNGNYACIG